MLGQSLRASRQSLVRLAKQQSATTFRRTFVTPTAVRQADLVQDLYLRELKAYKPPTVKASDSEGQVQKFSLPQAPASPEEADIASQLSAYETQEVEVEGQAEAGAAPVEDWYHSYKPHILSRTPPLTAIPRFDESELADEEPAHH
ncbi:hypothetical protein E4T48_00843 [Aureobasidium sp. EXF-10727]|nr:hypothetical protein E4T48_00843 [Aureobasidium sp. EXF-10727]KAI4730733.1 hypothetical protein E4T49_01574 [Aureobasidium sp. EXF-10728]